MKELSVSREVAAPAEVVWQLATDMDRWVDAIGGITKVERLDDGDGFGPGTRWRETRTMFGKEATEDIEVTEVEAGHRYDTLAESHGSRYRSGVAVEVLGTDRSRLTMTFSAEPLTTLVKVMAVVMGPLMMKATRKALEGDLADMAAAAEAATA